MSNQSLVLIITKIHIITKKTMIQISFKDKLFKNFITPSIILSPLSFIFHPNNSIMHSICQKKKSFNSSFKKGFGFMNKENQ